MYKLTNTTSIIRLTDNAFIPNDTGNTDYQVFLAWVAEGKKPESADIPDPQIAIKAEKVKSLSTITVKTSSGKVFDGNETARINMLSAIQSATFLNQTQAGWKLADNTVAIVTVNEIKEALALSIQRVGEIVTS